MFMLETRLMIGWLARSWTHALSERDEENIEDEHLEWSDLFLDNLPAVILRADAVTTLAPVVVC